MCLICTGPVTLQSRERLKRIYEQMPEPKFVVAVGSCAMSGGVFQGCYNVVGHIDEVIPVNAYIPGCPPRPEAIIDGVVKLLTSLQAPAPVEGGDEGGAGMSTDVMLQKAESLLAGARQGDGQARAEPAGCRHSSRGSGGRRHGAARRPLGLSVGHHRPRSGQGARNQIEALYHFCEGAAIATLRVTVPRAERGACAERSRR